jgi:hypothetical protein
MLGQVFANDPVHNNDCVCLFKQFLSSTELTQRPIVTLPFDRLQKLMYQNLCPLPRNVLTRKAITEFRKTAKVISNPPWGLTRGAEFLEKWVWG